jgi:hypothetical protein
VTPIGEQIMALPPAKRRCPQCLGPITYLQGCGRKKIPECKPCGGGYPRGNAGIGANLALNEKGEITGLTFA